MTYIAMAYVVTAWKVMAYVVMAYVVMAYIVMAYVVMAYIVMACIVMAYIVVAYIVVAYIVMAYIVMAYTVMAYIVMAYIVMACHCKVLSAPDWVSAEEAARLREAMAGWVYLASYSPRTPAVEVFEREVRLHTAKAFGFDSPLRSHPLSASLYDAVWLYAKGLHDVMSRRGVVAAEVGGMETVTAIKNTSFSGVQSGQNLEALKSNLAVRAVAMTT